MKAIDMTGQKIGRLMVIKQVKSKITPSGQPQRQYLCKCECGKEIVVRSLTLRNGETKSCGCYKIERAKENLKSIKPKHGLRYTRVYGIWKDMKQRCCNPNARHYDRYGGRGITVCEEWKNSPEAFYDWAMANGYTDELTIDRIDNNGNYEPSNCRWISMKEQASNRINSRFLTYKGEKHTITEWAEKTGISPSTISNRLKRGWGIEETLNKAP